MLSGLEDEVIPPKHMRELWGAANAPRNASADRDGGRTSRGSSSRKGEEKSRRRKGERDEKFAGGRERDGRFVVFPEGMHSELPFVSVLRGRCDELFRR